MPFFYSRFNGFISYGYFLFLLLWRFICYRVSVKEVTVLTYKALIGMTLCPGFITVLIQMQALINKHVRVKIFPQIVVKCDIMSLERI
jgi:hypothetical protein